MVASIVPIAGLADKLLTIGRFLTKHERERALQLAKSLPGKDLKMGEEGFEPPTSCL
jgi:hypothetical protein